MQRKSRQQLSFLVCVVAFGCSPDTQSPPSPISSAQESVTSTATTETPDPISVVESAIAAHGGADNFAKANVGRLTMEIDGELHPGLRGLFVVTDTFQLPGQFKRVVNGTVEGADVRLLFITNGEEEWVQVDDKEPMQLPPLNSRASYFPSGNLSFLLDLLHEPHELSVRPDVEINGQRTDCVRVTIDGQWYSNSYFDSETHLLVAAEKSVMDPQSESRRAMTTGYSEFKSVDGLVVPMVVETTVDGSPFVTMKVKKITFLPALDADIFQRPASPVH